MDKKILLIEDDAINQKVMKIMLEKEGYHIDISATANDALSKIPGNYQVILTDLGLPDMDGIELVKKIRKKAPDIFVIAVTGRVEDTLRQHCLDLGCKEVLTKPILRERLIEVVSDCS